MDLDEKQFAQCRANGRLEKPFDVESLRGLVRDLVPRTQSHRLANFLQFPDSFAEPLTLEEENKSQQTPPAPSQQKGDRWNMESFADISEFTVENPPETDAKPAVKTRGEAMAPSVAPSPITLSSDDDEDFEQIDLGMLGSSSPNPSVPVAAASGKKTAPPPPELPPLEPDPELEFTRTGELPPIPDATGISSDPSEAWSQQSLSRFKIPLPPVAVESEDLSLVLDDRGQLDSTQPLPPPPTHLEMPSDLTVEALPERDENLELTNFSGDARGGVSDRLSADELERIIRAQSKEIIESVVARIVPDMASEMIRKELERLLKENGELR